MAESNSNREPPLCPCGFWGSTQTSGLCSKCYKEKIARGENISSVHTNNSTAVATASSASPAVAAAAAACSQPSNAASQPTLASEEARTTEVQDAQISSTETMSAEATAAEVKTDLERPVQKNKKRCFKCKTRLELAFVEIGRCKCDYVFCETHRLPEQHDCTYDHKEQGRKEAREKMISPKKHVGTMLKRLDSDA